MKPFEAFFDAEDLSACVEAGGNPGEFNAMAQAHGCYFPLWLDPAQNFGNLFLEARSAPRSFRYGLVGDNVLGLQWRLPSGVELRLGGRVVKNVAGFDLIRFFNASHGRFGAPSRLVLRLRPLAEASLSLRFQGTWPGLKALARRVRASSWAHVLDLCDLHADTQAAGIHCHISAKPGLLDVFQGQAQDWALECGLELGKDSSPPEAEARPWARAQACLDDCVDLAQEWLTRYGGTVHVMLGQGTLHLSSPSSVQGAEQGIFELHGRLAAQGGHCEHPILCPNPDSPQARWETELLRRLGRIV